MAEAPGSSPSTAHPHNVFSGKEILRVVVLQDGVQSGRAVMWDSAKVFGEIPRCHEWLMCRNVWLSEWIYGKFKFHFFCLH